MLCFKQDASPTKAHRSFGHSWHDKGIDLIRDNPLMWLIHLRDSPSSCGRYSNWGHLIGTLSWLHNHRVYILLLSLLSPNLLTKEARSLPRHTQTQPKCSAFPRLITMAQ